jgi:anthranilate synthase component 1
MAKHYHLKTEHIKMLADVLTPVSIYLRLRDRFANSILLESSDYHGNENSFSYICCNPISKFELKDATLSIQWPGQHTEVKQLPDHQGAVAALGGYLKSFETDANPFKFINNGLFGYMSYDAVQYFEDIKLSKDKEDEYGIPEILYQVYRHVIAIDHFKNELYLFEHSLAGQKSESKLLEIADLLRNNNVPRYTFEVEHKETSNITDENYLEMVELGKKHCFRGDVFQIVLSRRFESSFKGDEFNVYRTLRSINPSPYLFYFDYGHFKIFGSSPEAQIVIKGEEAVIYPIAGTFRRTGNDEADAELARKLSDDPKENSEHVMLVDLARNDLSRNGTEVEVETFKEVQFYSHVIHLVSKVLGKLEANTNTVQIVADTFPAGTLSGAPKHKAMELIDQYEKTRRGYYGGAIGFLGFQGDFNHAIMIRSFLSHGHKLYYQAGAGVVAKSVEENELQEVNNKLAALRNAIEEAARIIN